MEKTKKRRRRRMVLLILLVAVLIWIAGCATGRSMSMGLSAIVPSIEKGGETIQGGSAPGSSNDGAASDDEGILTGVGGSGGADKPQVQPGEQSGTGSNGSGGHGDTDSGSQEPSGGTGAGSGGTTGSGASSGGNGGTGGSAGGEGGGTIGSGVNAGGAGGGSEAGGSGDGHGPSGGNGSSGNANPGGSNGSGQPVNGGTDAGQQPDKPTPPSQPGQGGDGKKLVALTFDDGPDTKYTTAILDILKDKGVKATFFVVGQQVTKYPEVLQRIADEGHAVGNHTQNHKDLKKQNKAGILEQINLTDKAIRDVLGETPPLFRAPYGSLSDTLKQILKEQGRSHTGWTVDTRDWAGTSVADMRAMIVHDTKPNGIILMHSFGGKHIKNTVQALPDVIDDLHKLGYTFVTVDELS